MSQPVARPAIRVVRSSWQPSPAAFLRRCREDSNETSRLNKTKISTWRTFSTSQVHRNQVAPPPFAPSSSIHPPYAPKRPFSSSAAARAIIVLQNPRVDDEGKDMTIDISPRAAQRLHQITIASHSLGRSAESPKSPQHSHLRVTVTSGGCHGFQYLMSLEPESKVDAEEDTIFASEEDAGPGKAEVVMDSASLELLKGSTIDFTTELIGSQFKIVGNPRAKSSCGCGTSFDID